MRRNETIETRDRLARNAALMGAGVGIALFAVFGLQPGAFIGGLLGVNMANAVQGVEVVPSILARGAVSLGMLLGVLATGLVFTVANAVLGWVAGRACTATLRAFRSSAGERIEQRVD
jgi:hypothetical protein